MTIRLGIVGYGGMGKWHEKNAPRVAGVEIVAICDIDPKKLKDISDSKYDVYLSAEEMFENAAINTVLLTVPNHLHKEMTIKAAKAGLNIIDEKPAALTVKEFDEMIAAVKENHVFFTVHQNRRWDRDFRIIKKLVDENQLGEVFTIESRLHTANGRIHEWHLYKKYGGGMMYDWGVHLIDQAMQMMKGAKPITIFADIRSIINDEVDDYFNLTLKFDNGITYHIELATYLLKYQPRWLAAGNRGTAYINSFACDGGIARTSELLDKLPAQIAETVAGPTRQFAPQPAGVLYEEPLPEVVTEWTDFYQNVVAAIEGKEEPLIKIAEVREVLRIMEAAVQSSETNQSVAL
ncbi:MAG: Gfo/Idh/MocA family protein [Enterococcus casseliflavus]|jgi:Predicted dehydrogenases and related proteins|nr:Gfo/Idh/MocA family oxidoreductase [Enterococcus casseliflavus]